SLGVGRFDELPVVRSIRQLSIVIDSEPWLDLDLAGDPVIMPTFKERWRPDVPKLITAHHPGQVAQQAREYVRTFILFPSGIVGLLCLIGGIGGLGYQWMATDTYSWTTFSSSSALIVVGLALGIAQTLYHRFIFAQFPEVLAARMNTRMKQRAGGVRG